MQLAGFGTQLGFGLEACLSLSSTIILIMGMNLMCINISLGLRFSVYAGPNPQHKTCTGQYTVL